MNTAKIHDRTQEIRLLVAAQIAVLWMENRKIPLLTEQHHQRAWLELDAQVCRIQQTLDEEQRRD